MDARSLESASAYLNNLLLARGLLRNGKAIDFARPDRASDGTEATMAKVINLVHDMVLRRDREAEQRELLATNVRKLRTEESQRVSDTERIQNRNAELARNISAMEAQERNLQASLRKAETQARDLREQILKMRSTLDQVRAKCISDVRKRDVELEKLKTHLTGLQRGRRDASGMKINVLNPQPALTGAREVRGGQDVNSADWSLEKETNDFLSALVNETSTENVALRNIVCEAVTELKHLTGMDQEGAHNRDEEDDGIGIPGQYRKSRQRLEAIPQGTLVSCDSLAAEMDLVLQHCRAILKDPSFVSIEEVQVREEEIIKLRQGWEKMAGRWKDAVMMLDTWRRRMQDGGDEVNLDELRSLAFGRSVAVLPNGEAVIGKDEDLSAMLFDDSDQESTAEHQEVDASPPLFRHGYAEDPPPEDEEDESDLEIPPEPSPKRLAASPARRGVKIARPATALTETNGNSRVRPLDNKRAVSFNNRGDSGIGSLDGSLDIEKILFEGSAKPRSKIARQMRPENKPPMTVAEKLAAVEAEAKEAEGKQQQEERPRKRKASKPLLKPIGSRRRSTLSPEELASLMGVR